MRLPLTHILLALLCIAGLATAGTPMSLPAASGSPSADALLHYGTLTFSLQERIRGEWRENNYDFDNSATALTDDAWLLERTRIGVEWKAKPWLRFFVEGQDTREFFADRPNVLGQFGAEGDDAFDLRQGFIEVGDPKHLSLQVGRQVLVYGDKRLISSGEWGNASRTFDALRLHYQHDDWWLEAFASSVVKLSDGRFNESTWFDGSSGNDQFFSGLYFSTKALGFQTTDIYALELHQNDAGGTDFLTLGTRWSGDPLKLNGWDYAVEMAAQTGDLKGEDLEAFAGHWDVGYNWLSSAWKPRLGLEYSYASGDNQADDGRTTTFQNLFPTNHLYYGFMDLFAWQNLHNPALHFSLQPTKSVKLMLDYHCFWLASTNDAWYRANITSTARSISAGASSYAGSELDFTVAWKATKYLDVQAGYSHFFAGDYLRDTGAHDDADFPYLMITFNL